MDFTWVVIAGFCLLGATFGAVSIRNQRRNTAMNDFAIKTMRANPDDRSKA
jgi:hypothetical protein